MVCPKCKSEFRVGITKCPDCECILVSGVDVEKSSEKYEFMKPVKIYECETELEARMIQEALENAKISSFIRGNGSGDYLKIGTGLSFLGSGIYVDEMYESVAIKIVSGITQTIVEDDIEDEEELEIWKILEEGQGKAQQRKRFVAGIVLGIAVICTIVFILLTQLS